MTDGKDILDASTMSRDEPRPSFSLKNRALRAAWGLTWGLLASWTPPPMHAWRRALLRLFGAKIAHNAIVYGSTKVWFPPNLEMKRNSSMGWQVNCYNQARITLEEGAIVSQYAHLVAGTHDIDDPFFQLRVKPIIIGKGAWIASGAFVGPGVVIGEGAVLGARGVTFKSLSPWTVFAGNPAKEIRPRKLAPKLRP